MEEERKKGKKEENFHESPVSYTSSSSVLLPHSSSVSDFSRDSSSFMLALLQQLSGWFHPDATQTPLTVFFVISSCFLSKSETPSLTSTPTHLQNGHQLRLCSNFSLWHRFNLCYISSVALRPDWLCSDTAMTPLLP